jgi:hypothetical protein
LSFLRCLAGIASQTGDHHNRPLRALRLLCGEPQHGLVQACFADRELRGVHADRESAAARSEVIARERALAALVEAAPRVERERMRRDHGALVQRRSDFRWQGRHVTG